MNDKEANKYSMIAYVHPVFVLRTAYYGSICENIGKLRRGQRNLPRFSSHTDLRAVRESIGFSIASTDSGHFEILRMANDIEGTFDSTYIQTKISLRSKELPRNTLDIPDKQSR